jgi:hypothetical protein
MHTLTLDEKIKEWKEQDALLKLTKKKEMALRRQIAAELSQTVAPNVKSYVHDDDIKVEFKTTVKLDEELFNELKSRCLELDDGVQILNCIKYKPSIVAKEVKKLESDSEFFDCISTEPATPTIKILDPE